MGQLESMILLSGILEPDERFNQNANQYKDAIFKLGVRLKWRWKWIYRSQCSSKYQHGPYRGSIFIRLEIRNLLFLKPIPRTNGTMIWIFNFTHGRDFIHKLFNNNTSNATKVIQGYYTDLWKYRSSAQLN